MDDFIFSMTIYFNLNLPLIKFSFVVIMTNFHLFFVALLLLIPRISFSQQETFNWKIGRFNTLKFTSNPPVFLTQNLFTYEEASATISDDNGNLLYYTNGLDVYDGTQNIINNGNNISGINQFSNYPEVFSSTQGCVFQKVPRNNSLILLFTLNDFYSIDKKLKYNIINLNQNTVVVKSRTLSDQKALSEKMIIANHCNNVDKWLITSEHSLNSSNKIIFHVYLITENGVQNTAVSSQIDLNDVFCLMSGQMKVNNQGNQIVMSTDKGIALFQFDSFSGDILLQKTINTPEIGSGYGIEYSPNDKILYVDENQIDLATEQIFKYKPEVSFSQLQIGCDDKIYRYGFVDSIYINNSWIKGGRSIETINNPNQLNSNCDFQPNVFQFIDSTFPTIGLPNIPQYLFKRNKAEFSYSPSCQGDSIILYLTNSSLQFDLIKWEVNGVEYANEDTISVYFPAEGTYSVTCYVEKDSLTFSSTQCVTVCGPLDVILPPLINICASDSIVLNTMNTCSLSYLWNTGDTTSSIVIKDEGIYWIKTTNVCGVNYDTIIVNKEDCIPVVEIPNVFTPNNDNSNDNFTINIKGAKSINIYILNRWGDIIKDSSIVFSSQNIANTNNLIIWDGLINQSDATEGVYFYGIKYISENNNEFEKTGFIHLIR